MCTAIVLFREVGTLDLRRPRRVDENVTSNITLRNRKSLAIIPSRSSRTMLAKNPKNKLVGAVSE